MIYRSDPKYVILHNIKRAFKKHYELKKIWLGGREVSDKEYENSVEVFYEECNFDYLVDEFNFDIVNSRHYYEEVRKFKKLRDALNNSKINISQFSFKDKIVPPYVIEAFNEYASCQIFRHGNLDAIIKDLMQNKNFEIIVKNFEDQGFGNLGIRKYKVELKSKSGDLSISYVGISNLEREVLTIRYKKGYEAYTCFSKDFFLQEEIDELKEKINKKFKSTH